MTIGAKIKLNDGTDTFSAAIKAQDAALAADVTWTLPGADGTAGQALVTDGSANLSWATDLAGINSPQATAFTLNAQSPEEIYISNPVTTITQFLPTTNVLAGRKFRLVVTNATYLSQVELYSSNGSLIETIGGNGYVLVQALTASPVSAGGWSVIDVYEDFSTPATSVGLTSNQTLTFNFTRKNKACTVSFDAVGVRTKDGTNGTIAFPALVSRFRPLRDQVFTQYGLATVGTPMAFNIRNTGEIQSGPWNATSGDYTGFVAGQTPIGWLETFSAAYDLR